MAKGLGKGLGALIHESEDLQIEKENPIKSERPQNLPSTIEVDENGGLWVDPTLLKPNPKQPREEFNPKQLEELSDSIKENGILQPIIIENAENGDFYIIAGERRTRAAKMAGLQKVPVQLRKFDEVKKLEVALIENIQRADLNPIEEANAYYNLIQLSELSQDEVAKRVGKNRSTVANAIRLLRLPEDIQHSLSNGQISAGHARAILMVKNDSDMRILYGKIIGSSLSVREAESLADQYNNGGRAVSKKKEQKRTKKDPDVENFEQDIKNIFGVKNVELKGDMEKGALVINYSSHADFDRIYNVLNSLK